MSKNGGNKNPMCCLDFQGMSFITVRMQHFCLLAFFCQWNLEEYIVKLGVESSLSAKHSTI